jgi:Flp pilus assembly protein TadG
MREATMWKMCDQAIAHLRSVTLRVQHDDTGSILLLSAFTLVVLLGLAGMVTDVGIIYWDRRLLQNAVDGAALAGAAQLPINPNASQTVAQAYAQDNGVAAGDAITITVSTTFNTNDTLTVSASRELTWGLRYVVGAGDATIPATAAAIVVPTEPGTIAPWAVSRSEVTAPGGSACTTTWVECDLKEGGSDGSGGNFGALDWSSIDSQWASGNPGYVQSLTTGYTGPLPTPVAISPVPTWSFQVETLTGNHGSNTQNAIAALFADDDAELCRDGVTSCAPLYQNPALDPNVPAGTSFYPSANAAPMACYTDLRCPRVALVPIIDNNWQQVNGRYTVTVTGFACMYLTQNVGNAGHTEVYGLFLPTCNGRSGKALYGGAFSNGIQGSETTVFLWR